MVETRAERPAATDATVSNSRLSVEGEACDRCIGFQMAGSATAMAGGLSFLSACNDDVVGAEAVATPTPTGTATSTVLPPTYTATDNDRLNFGLQLHYLLAAYLHRALDGGALSASMTGGAGAAGTVTGGRRVAFTDLSLLAMMREVSDATDARIAYLRRTLASAVTAQPAINIAGGEGSPFQAIAITKRGTPPPAVTSFFDPYASENDFLLGAVALSSVVTQAIYDVTWQLAAALRTGMAAFAAGIAASDAILRNSLFVRADADVRVPAAGQSNLFGRAVTMALGRDQYDGPRAMESDAPGIGGFAGADWVYSKIDIVNYNWIAIRRTPEQALGILYASAASVSSGAFFPAGVNGTIRVSGANTY